MPSLLDIRNPTPYTLNPQPYTLALHPKPYTLIPQPYTPGQYLARIFCIFFLSAWKGREGVFRVQGSGFRAQGSGFRVQGAGFRVQGSGFRVQGSGFRVQGSGFKHLARIFCIFFLSAWKCLHRFRARRKQLKDFYQNAMAITWP